jgi:glutamyl-tRNA synthetase
MPFLVAAGCDVTAGPRLEQVIALMKERVSTIEELAAAAVYFYCRVRAPDELVQLHLTDDVKPALRNLRQRFESTEWNRAKINETIKSVIGDFKLKLPNVAMPLRVAVAGTTHTPSIDATLELIGRDEVLARMDKALQA